LVLSVRFRPRRLATFVLTAKLNKGKLDLSGQKITMQLVIIALIQ
jgi:hypothetical protein